MKKYKDYKEDVTRGNGSRLNPINYKPDTLVQTWVDARKLVMLDNWLEKNNYHTRYMADIVKYVVDIIIDQLLEAGEVERVEYSRSATDALCYKFKKNTLNPGGRGKRNIIHNLTLDERRRDVMSSMDSNNSMNNNSILTPQVGQTISPEREAMYADSDKRNAELDEQERKDMIGSLQTDENGIVLPPDMTGTYTKEDREREIAATREALGIAQAQPTVESPLTSKSPLTSDVNKTLAKSLLDKLTPKSSAVPAKLTNSQILAHEQRVKDKDDALRDSWDSVDHSNILPDE